MVDDNRPRILVVDDEPDTAGYIKTLLKKKFGASVEIADCAEIARKKFGEGFDLITLDYQMPGCDGLTLLEEIISMPNPPVVIMVTGHGDEETAIAAYEGGVSSYVRKDDRLTQRLTDAVETCLRRSEEK